MSEMTLLERLRDPVFGGRLGLLGGEAADRIAVLEAALKRIAIGTHTTLENGMMMSTPFSGRTAKDIARHALALSKGSDV